MVKKSEKIRNQLLIALSFFTLTGVIVASVSVYFFRKIHDVHKVSASVHTLFQEYVKATKSEQEFIHLETSKSTFFASGKSNYLNEYNSHIAKAKREIDKLKSQQAYHDFKIGYDVDKLSNEISKYETFFDFTIEKVKHRGFKDFGTEGVMRKYVHDLESKSDLIGLANVLMLRRHEKDFLLRNDDAYVTKLQDKIESINNRIWRNKKLSNIQKDNLIMLLTNYRHSFLDLVKVIKEIGFKDEQGLSGQLLNSKEIIDNQFIVIHSSIVKNEELMVDNLEKGFLIIIVNIIAITMFIIFMYTKKLRKQSFNFASQGMSTHDSSPRVEDLIFSRRTNIAQEA